MSMRSLLPQEIDCSSSLAVILSKYIAARVAQLNEDATALANEGLGDIALLEAMSGKKMNATNAT